MYTVGNYLLDRLSELGIREIFGVPGDYNLKFLDHVMTHKELKWIGNANELNAAYAADGYARTKGIAALVTTFGVGELSAANGTAGSFAEKVPVVQIVGTPTTGVQNSKKLVHHTLGDGRFDHFEKMQSQINGAIAHLTAENALEEIDRVLQIAVTKRCPVYINLAIDVAEVTVEKPVKPLMGKSETQDEETMAALKKIETALQESINPVILVGNEIASFHVEAQLAEFSKKFNLPVTVLPFGKGAFDEEDPHFIGVYTGAPTAEKIKERVEKADLILIIGAKLTDSATAGFSYGFKEEQVLSVGSDEVSYYGERVQGVQFKEFVEGLSQLNYTGYQGDIQPVERLMKSIKPTSSNLTQTRFWQFVESFLSPEDTLVAEQGTSFFGASLVPLKSKMNFIGQPLWGSIGYTFPATLGSQIANPASRHLLFIGDGSLQLTIQEIGMAFREKLTPIIFVINNDGYTVEREIHGPTEKYNDIPAWDYQNLPYVFGGNESNVVTYKVTTEEELFTAMNQARQDTTRLQWIEVVMGKMDSPDLLVQLGKVFAKQNS